MRKKTVIDMIIHKGLVTVNGIPTRIALPPGCIGMCFVFESKAAAYNFGSRESDLTEVGIKKKGNYEKSM